MMPPRSHRPSPGFIMLVVIHSLILAFLIWSLRTPDLDRVWTLHHLLKIGQLGRTGKLKADDRAVLERSLARHPTLAADLLDGRAIGLISANRDGWIATPHAIIIRTAGDKLKRSLVLELQTPRDLFPYTISVHAAGWKKKIKIKERGIVRVPLPAPGAHGDVLELRAHGKAFKADPSMLGIRVGFEAKS